MLDEKTALERDAAMREGIRQWWVMILFSGVGVIAAAIVTALWWPARPLVDSAGRAVRGLTTPGIWFMPIMWAVVAGNVADLAGWPVFHRPLPMPWRGIVNFGFGVAVGFWFARGPQCRLSVSDAIYGRAWMAIVSLCAQVVALVISDVRRRRIEAAGKRS